MAVNAEASHDGSQSLSPRQLSTFKVIFPPWIRFELGYQVASVHENIKNAVRTFTALKPLRNLDLNLKGWNFKVATG